jgi:cysteine desulfurase / selenocysteine lyase
MTTHFEVYRRREDFPILKTTVKGNPLAYMDNAASTQKPIKVIEAMDHFYRYQYSNVHRGNYSLSETATELFEQARRKVQRFIWALCPEEIVFTRGATESINLVAQSYLRSRLKPNDEILISQMEHHSNIVPWQQLCQQTGAILKVIPLNEKGLLHLPAIDYLLNARTCFMAVTHLSNVLGTLNPIDALIKRAHQYNVPVLIDGAQAVAHLPVNVQHLGCDFYVFSGHKMYGPTGIGVLYAKKQHLDEMAPWQSGGGMVRHVSFDHTEYREPPYCFEAGTPPIAESIGLGAAIDYLTSIGWKALIAYESQLLNYIIDGLQTLSGLRLFGTTAPHLAVLSLIMDRVHAHDVATILNEEGIAARAGHHCAMPLMEFLQVPATLRVALGLYNTPEEVDRLVTGLRKAQALLG